ncbi:glycosyltransferase family 4 protein [Butyrivibrio sp. VCB2001]|uniref:glycosyltransferase family 4 protein n=1 Tax=Butyrivibrio sp. VCB2001 TaxID=1280667 RepID=UPI00040EFE48|nr:glycosyltransferase family 4 protein [Butyrivibrio sp. VCB2001]
MSKILVICQYFHPEQFRINDICCEWIKRGYDVTVLTGIPNYPQGRFYEGYGLFKKRKETWNGVKIIRIPLIPRGHTPIGMVLNYFSFPISGFFWNIFAKIKADYVFMFETSPMTQCKIGVRYAKKHKVPLYLYVQDLWPENVEIVTGIKNRLIIGPIDRMVDKIYAACDEIFVTSPSFVKAVTGRKKSVPEIKVHYWPQYAEEFYSVVDKKTANLNIQKELATDTKAIGELQNDQTFKVAFTGNIGYAQGLQILPQAAMLLKEIKNIRYVIVGDGRYKSKLMEEIHQSGVEDMFIMIDRQSPELIPDILALCDAAYISFMDTELFTWTIPAKLQSYMACGMPIIASASGETKRIIEEANCGRCVPIGEAKSLAETIQDISAMSKEERHNLGVNSREYFEANFKKQKLMDEFERYLNREK